MNINRRNFVKSLIGGAVLAAVAPASALASLRTPPAHKTERGAFLIKNVILTPGSSYTLTYQRADGDGWVRHVTKFKVLGDPIESISIPVPDGTYTGVVLLRETL